MERPFSNEEILAGRLAYEEDRRNHNHWQPHWEEVSHSDRIHWIICTKGKKVDPPPAVPKGPVVVVR